ncbi:MAG: MiaB/RimO family radical SAM methylthiotransferase [Rikenellaceae bacterium]
MTRSYKIYTLGCKLNYAESSTIARSMDEGGMRRAQRGEIANKVVVNSCAVTAQSEKKTRELIRRVVRENPNAEVVVTGCYAKLREPEILNIKGVTAVQTTKAITAWSYGERTRSFLKVQDGCNYHCTYCTVWRARGISRNAPIAEVVEQAEQIASRGVKEIVLTGVNTGDFGRSTGESFLELLYALEAVDGIERYRISSIEPNLLTQEIIEFCASSQKFMPHFHLPLQSGSNRILGGMGRRYNAQMFIDKVDAVRALIPNVFIGVDVIVGFPSESEQDFSDTVEVLKRVGATFLHVFPYSQRPDTLAAEMVEQIPEPIKKERVATLNKLSDELLSDFTERELSKPQEVLVEGRARSGKLFGHTANYIRVELDEGDDSLIGKVVRFRHNGQN